MRTTPLALAAALLVICAPLSACRADRQTPPGPAPTVPPTPPPPLYTDAERAAVVAYWNAPGRYTVGPPSDMAKDGGWRVRLTPEGSTWLLAYQRAVVGKGKIPPTQDARATGPNADWEAWVAAKVAWDRRQAHRTADAHNAALGLKVKPGPREVPPPETAFPGPAPASLVAACGNPPVFAAAVAPQAYTIAFEDGDAFTYTDHVPMRERYAYYRFARGVNSGGASLAKMTDTERDALFKAAGFTPGERRIFEAISKHEGGFDAVQTYDTGYLSVGFIQFVTLAEGKHDLSNVLLQQKADVPDAYVQDFRRFGIDVRAEDKTLVVVDPATGAELSGPDAVQKIIDDKRLLAVFQRAGRRTPFRVAQIKVARAYYWPSEDPITVKLADGKVLTGKVGDVVKSEAGLAVLLDRKINTGNWRPLEDVIARVLTEKKCPGESVTEATVYERDIVAALKYRFDALADPTLQKP